MGQSAIAFFMNTEVPPDDVETELYNAATEAFRRGWTFMEASFQIGGRATDLGLSENRIENVLRSSFDLEKRREYRSEELDSEAKEKTHSPEMGMPMGSYMFPGNFFESSKKSSRYINIESAIIPWPSDEWRFDFAELLHKAFDPEELVGINKKLDSPLQLQKVDDILKVRENVPQIMRSLDGVGGFIRVNPCGGEREVDVQAFRHVLLKVKNLELGKQLAFFKIAHFFAQLGLFLVKNCRK